MSIGKDCLNLQDSYQKEKNHIFREEKKLKSKLRTVNWPTTFVLWFFVIYAHMCWYKQILLSFLESRYREKIPTFSRLVLSWNLERWQKKNKSLPKFWILTRWPIGNRNWNFWNRLSRGWNGDKNGSGFCKQLEVGWNYNLTAF